MPTQADFDAIERANERLSELDAIEMMKTVVETLGDRVAILSGMQRAGAVLCHMAQQAGLALDVVFVDTGVLHKETIETRDAIAKTHDRLRIVTVTPERSFAEQTAAEGVLYLTQGGQERCCDLRKSAPLRALKGRYDALFGALRKGEGGKRSAVRALELDSELGAVRVHPLVNWTDEALREYVLRASEVKPGRTPTPVVVNPLHAMGFPTIGCFPCTTPVRADEPERAGRWRHLADVAYCGINPTDVRREQQMDVSQNLKKAIARWGDRLDAPARS